MDEIKNYMNRHVTTMVKGLLDRAEHYFQISGSEDYGRFHEEISAWVKLEHKRDITQAGFERTDRQSLERARKSAMDTLKQAVKDGHWLSIRTETEKLDKCVLVTDENGREVISIAL